MCKRQVEQRAGEGPDSVQPHQGPSRNPLAMISEDGQVQTSTYNGRLVVALQTSEGLLPLSSLPDWLVEAIQAHRVAGQEARLRESCQELESMLGRAWSH